MKLLFSAYLCGGGLA